MGLALVTLFLLTPAVALACIAVAVPVIWLTAKYNAADPPNVRARTGWLTATSHRVCRSRSPRSRWSRRTGPSGASLARFDDDSHRALNAAFFLRLEIVLLSALAMTVGGGVAIFAEYVLAGWVLEGRETYLGAAAAVLISYTVWNLGAFNYARDQVEEGLGNGHWLIRIWCMSQDLFIGLERAFFLLDLEPDIVDGDDPSAFPGAAAQRHLRGGALRLRDARCRTVPRVARRRSRRPCRHHHRDRRRYRLRQVDPHVDDPAPLRPRERAGPASTTSTSRTYASTTSGPTPPSRCRRTCCLPVPSPTTSATRPTARHSPTWKPRPRSPARTSSSRRWTKATRPNSASAAASCPPGNGSALSIARAVVRNTPILILDEPTASLDAETERELLGNLGEWGADKVVFLITHRLSTIRNATRSRSSTKGGSSRTAATTS